MHKICLLVIAIAFFTMPLWGANPQGPSNVLLLHFNESSAGTFQDASGNGYTASCSGSGCPQAGLRGELGAGLNFDGKKNVVQIGGMGFGDFTMEVWVYGKSSLLKGGECLNGNPIVRADGPGESDDWILSQVSNKICFSMGAADPTQLISMPLDDTQWHHIAITRNTHGNKQLFVDGVLQAVGSGMKADMIAKVDVQIGGNTADSRYFKGMIDEVAIYNGILPDEDIANHYKTSVLRQEAVLDPKGRFVIYAAPVSGCVNARPLFQAIGENGTPVGSPKQLVECGFLPEDVVGIDVMPDGLTTDSWISFGGSQVSDARYLMKINSQGKVILSPKSVVTASALGNVVGATAMADGTRLKLWSTGYDGWLYGSTINKLNRSTLSTKKAQWSAASMTGLHYAYTPTRQFMACEVPAGVFTAFGMVNGTWDGTTWRLSPRTDRAHKTGSVSADGLMALSNATNPRRDVLYAQPLNTKGHPLDDPKIVASNARFGVVDVSNALPAGTRFVLYGINGAFYIQKMNAVSGDPLGKAVLVNH